MSKTDTYAGATGGSEACRPASAAQGANGLARNTSAQGHWRAIALSGPATGPPGHSVRFDERTTEENPDAHQVEPRTR